MRLLLNLAVLSFVLAGCASGGGRRSTPPAAQPLGGAPPASVQALFESGRDDEAVSRSTVPGLPSAEVWFGAQSLLRVGQRGEAIAQFTRLRDGAESETFRRAADVALARVNAQADAMAVAQNAGREFPADAFVQFEVGVTFALQGDMTAAAQAFDAALSATPSMAYAYYQAGLAYNRLDRADLTVTRFEAFVRLAPSAPERGQVETVLRAARGR